MSKTAAAPIALGIIGVGSIFPAYLKTLRRSGLFRIVGLADSVPAQAERRAAETGLPTMSVDALLDSGAQIILNLTPPLAHYEIGRRVLAAGKHFFTEKPLAANFEQGNALVALARERGLRVGCAPDTVLGAGAQALRALIDSGVAGPIRHGCATFMGHGPDDWHPNPDFFYGEGAGPMLDLGPYYVTHLVNALGPVRSLRGSAHITHRWRRIRAGANAGRHIDVAVPTHVVTLLSFTSGTQVVLTTSFDVWRHGHAPIELYGDEGTLVGHDPNRFGGTVRISLQGQPWQHAPGGRPYHANTRGIGLIDMAQAIAEQRPHRCNDALALHVLEVMDRAVQAGLDGSTVQLTTTCERPAPLGARLF